MFDIRKQKVDEKSRHTLVSAQCDTCGDERWVRKSFALAKIKKSGYHYKCRSCAAKKNLAQAPKGNDVDDQFINEYVEIAKFIYANCLDDKSKAFIQKQIGKKNIGWFIESARDIVADFISGSVPNNVTDCCFHIEEESDQTIIDLFSDEVQLKAHAILALELMPVPSCL